MSLPLSVEQVFSLNTIEQNKASVQCTVSWDDRWLTFLSSKLSQAEADRQAREQNYPLTESVRTVLTVRVMPVSNTVCAMHDFLMLVCARHCACPPLCSYRVQSPQASWRGNFLGGAEGWVGENKTEGCHQVHEIALRPHWTSKTYDFCVMGWLVWPLLCAKLRYLMLIKFR